jgi:hypothetical protein
MDFFPITQHIISRVNRWIVLARPTNLWNLYMLKKRTEGAQFVEPSIYSMDHTTTAQAVYSTASGHFMRPGEVSVRNTSKGVRTEPLRLRNHQWLYEGLYPVDHEAAGQRILVGQSINLPTAKTSPFGERSDQAAGSILNSVMCAVRNTLRYTFACAPTGERTRRNSSHSKGRARC